VHDPDIIILDEPFSGLDPLNATLLKNIIKEQITKGKIVLLSSHQMNYIKEFCDSIAIINDGIIVLNDDIQNIKLNYPRDQLVIRTKNSQAIIDDFGSTCRVAENGDLIIKLKSPNEKKSVMTHLITDYDIDELKVLEPSLDEIFTEYTVDTGKED
jgi:ABC-2 type transport system ATP-binding protein